MEEAIKKLVRRLHLNPGAREDVINSLVRSLHISLPKQYVDFMRFSNGAEGEIGASNYLVIWPAEEVVELNEGYAVSEFAPGLVLFGGDGGDTGYAFDVRFNEMPIVKLPLVGMDIKLIEPLGENFKEFLEALLD